MPAAANPTKTLEMPVATLGAATPADTDLFAAMMPVAEAPAGVSGGEAGKEASQERAAEPLAAVEVLLPLIEQQRAALVAPTLYGSASAVGNMVGQAADPSVAGTATSSPSSVTAPGQGPVPTATGTAEVAGATGRPRAAPAGIPAGTDDAIRAAAVPGPTGAARVPVTGPIAAKAEKSGNPAAGPTGVARSGVEAARPGGRIEAAPADAPSAPGAAPAPVAVQGAAARAPVTGPIAAKAEKSGSPAAGPTNAARSGAEAARPGGRIEAASADAPSAPGAAPAPVLVQGAAARELVTGPIAAKSEKTGSPAAEPTNAARSGVVAARPGGRIEAASADAPLASAPAPAPAWLQGAAAGGAAAAGGRPRQDPIMAPAPSAAAMIAQPEFGPASEAAERIRATADGAPAPDVTADAPAEAATPTSAATAATRLGAGTALPSDPSAWARLAGARTADQNVATLPPFAGKDAASVTVRAAAVADGEIANGAAAPGDRSQSVTRPAGSPQIEIETTAPSVVEAIRVEHSGPLLPIHTAQPAAVAANLAPAATPSLAQQLAVQVLDIAADGAWIDELARDIGKLASGSGDLRFRLTPETLGELRVEISQSERGASIRMAVSSEAAQAAIAEAQPRLLAEARAQGLRIADAQVDLASSQQGRGDEHRQQQAQAGQPLRAIRTPQSNTAPAAAAHGAQRADRYA